MVEVYNFLDGKHLCNIFASLIVNKINESFPDANTKISVINVRNFFVVKGKTSSDVVLNLSDLLREFCESYSEELANSIRVFDMILYGQKIESNNIIVEYSDDKNNINEIQQFVNDQAKLGLYFNLKVDYENNVYYFDCIDTEIEKVQYTILDKYPDVKPIKKDFSLETYVSDDFYGLSNNNEKYYHILLRYITNHLFKRGISSNLKLRLSCIGSLDKIDNESINLNVDGKFIVKKDWLTSLILDIFPFEYNDLKERFNLNGYLSHEIYIDDNSTSPWEKLDLVTELILI